MSLRRTIALRSLSHGAREQVVRDNIDRFVAAIFHIEITGQFGDAIDIGNGLTLTVDKTALESFLTPEVERAVGSLEASALRRAPAFFYGELDASHSEKDQLANLRRCLRNVTWFFHALWLVKDHGAHIEQGFLGRSAAVSSNLLPGQVTTPSRGKHDRATVFSKAELEDAASFFAKTDDRAKVGGTFLTKDESRLGRAFYVLQHARSSDDTVMKIADYCVCFETLIGTSGEELTHRLAERVALLVADTGDARRSTYLLVRRAYGIRSRAMHGDGLSPKNAGDLEDVAERCDGILRSLFVKILTDQSVGTALASNEEKTNDFFLRLLFAV